MINDTIRNLIIAWIDGSTIEWSDDPLDASEDDWNDVPDEDVHKLKTSYQYRKNKKFRLKTKVTYIVPYHWITYHEVIADSREQALELASEIEVSINAYVNGEDVNVEFDDMGEPELELQ